MFKNLFQNWFNEPQQLDYANYSSCKNYYHQNYPELRKLLIGENDQDVICMREIDDPRFSGEEEMQFNSEIPKDMTSVIEKWEHYLNFN